MHVKNFKNACLGKGRQAKVLKFELEALLRLPYLSMNSDGCRTSCLSRDSHASIWHLGIARNFICIIISYLVYLKNGFL
jgi:hypothetical protein